MDVADAWYGVEPFEDGIFRVREIQIDPYWSSAIWVINGRDLSLVFDTGTGIVSPAATVEALVSTPVLAVSSAHYYDHSGGLYGFIDVACHKLEAEHIADPPDTTYNFLKENRLKALPHPGYVFDAHRQKPAKPTRLLDDGDMITLGDRQLEVIHVPGRTPGGIVLWEAATGSLFGGEVVFLDPLDRPFPPTDAQLYERALKRLGSLPVRNVYGGHFGRFGAVEFAAFVEREIGRYSH